MKFYQNNKLVAVLEKQSNMLLAFNKNKELAEVGKEWDLRTARGKLIEKIIVDSDINTFNAEMLMVVCKKLKIKLALSDEEVEIIADNQEELEQQRIVLDIKE
ncbi:hypothetical protein [uncultured Helicobacter sp.]|uniref:hypothetical protein n=1 Tax=uncultured Helicobacter sp. TaxID=175537 RepID=UPI00260EABE1|nr:hypothetical protein [uncultured Helicobacter sp.]